jgi:hypothetical protein
MADPIASTPSYPSPSASASASNHNRPVLTGMFRDRDSAERAYQDVLARGYSDKDIDVVMSDDTRRQHFSTSAAQSTELGTKAAEGAGIGAGVGGAVGAALAAVAAVGTSIAIPGLGLVVAGPVAAALAGAGAGGAAGGLLGALVGWTIPEERVKAYEGGLRDGGILLGLRPRTEDDAREIEARWRESAADPVYR